MLADLVPEKRKILFNDGEFEVRGLTVSDLGKLIKDFRKEMAEWFMQDEIDIEKIVTESPDLVAYVIALAAGEPDQRSKVELLPVGIQAQALEDIWDMTNLEASTVGKIAAGLATWAAELTSKLGVNN